MWLDQVLGEEMKVAILWLRWFFVPSGVVYREERGGKLSWFEAIKRLFSGGIKRGTPSSEDFAKWAALKKPLKRYGCKTCGEHFWAWRKSAYCGRFSCIRASK